MALYKRPNSKYWWMKFTFDGSLIQQSTKCSNRRDAATVESAYRTQLALGKIGIHPKKEAPTFEAAAKNFLEWSRIEHSRNTYDRYYYGCQPLKNSSVKPKLIRSSRRTSKNISFGEAIRFPVKPNSQSRAK